MSKRVAVMDLGTNTFHLLIAEGDLSYHRELIHLSEGVKLGEGGINKGYILPEAFERGLQTMQQFGKKISELGVTEVKAIATSMLRSASNGKEFIEQVKSRSGISIDIIDGDTEAAYIYNGVKMTGCLSAQNSLIMDIGGGSVEFILGNANTVIWKQSFEIGAARLMDKFHQADPIPQQSIDQLNQYLTEKLDDLFTATSTCKPNALIGSSGAFETFAGVIETGKGNPFDLKAIINYNFNEDELLTVTNNFIRSTHEQRAANKGIIPVRVDMIVVASLITRFVMDKLGIHNVGMCTYSLKEGVLAGMLG